MPFDTARRVAARRAADGAGPAKPFRVVVVGAGFGGLEAARALARAPVEITLLDRQNHHLFQPLLYQVATAALSPGDIAWPARTIFRRQRNATVVMAEATGVDAAGRVVLAGDKLSFPYDALLLATGSTHSYFGHDEWAPVAPGLKTIEDATDIRRRLLLAFERAEVTDDEAERRRLLTFAVVGGGPRAWSSPAPWSSSRATPCRASSAASTPPWRGSC